MSSKVRKPGQNRLQNRPSGRGKQQPSQNFGRSHSKEYNSSASGGQNLDFVLSEFSNSDISASVIPLVGCHVLVQTVADQVYDGILNTVSSSFSICLTNAHLQSCTTQKRQDSCNTPNREEIIPEISFDLRHIISIKCKNVDLDFARKDLFQTDSMISGSNGPSVTERELKPWLPDKDDIHNSKSLEEMQDMKNGVNYNELKRANEERFNFTSTFNEETMSQYMHDIETDNKEVYLQREREAKRIAEEIQMEASHRYHDALDSGITEEEKFSSVKRPGFTSSPNRNSNASSRGRGRSRAPGFSNYREPSNEQLPESKFNKNPVGTNKRITNNDETPNARPLYSQLVQRSTQPDSQHGQNNDIHHHHQQQQQQHVVPYQPPALQRQRMQNEASLSQQQKITSNQNSPNVNHNLPPRMQQQQQQKLINMETSNQNINRQQQQHQSEHATSKPRSDSQPIVVSAASPSTGQRSVSFDNEKEAKKNRDVLINSAKGGSLDKTSIETSSSSSSSSADMKIIIPNELAKGSTEIAKHAEDVFKDTKTVARHKYGKIVQPHEESVPDIDIDDLKSFNKKFKLMDSKSQKRQKKIPEVNRGQPKEPEKTDSESLIIKLSPDPPVKETVERLPQVQKIAIRDESFENEENKKSEKDEKEKILFSKNDMNQPDQKPTKVEEVKHEIEAVSSQTPTPAFKKGLNPNAKEFKLNPNATEFVPPSPSPSLPATPHTYVQNMPTGQQYQQPRIVAASSPALQGNVQQIPVIQTQGMNRYAKVYPGDHVMDSSTVSTPTIHQGFIQQQQQQPAMQPQQQSPVVFVQYQTPLVTTIPQQHGIGRPQWHQPQGHVGHPHQLIPQDGNPSMIIVNQHGSHIVPHQQQSQPIHASHITYSHPATQQVQQPIHYMVPSQQGYPQIASPLNTNVQATPVLHGMQRPPTPSQHSVHHSVTPPMHHHGQPVFYGTNQMTGINMQPQTTFVAPPRGQLQMQTYQ